MAETGVVFTPVFTTAFAGAFALVERLAAAGGLVAAFAFEADLVLVVDFALAVFDGDFDDGAVGFALLAGFFLTGALAEAFFLVVEAESAGAVPGAIAIASAAPATAIAKICTVRISSPIRS